MNRFVRTGLLALVGTTLLTSCGGGRKIRTAQDITPGNPRETQMDWRYGATDIQIQTSKLTKQLMDRWYLQTGFQLKERARPRIIITEIDNRTDMYLSTDMIRDIFEGAAVTDGRFTIVVGDARNEDELDEVLYRLTHDPKYSNSSRPQQGQAKAPQFLAKIRLTKAVTQQKWYDLEDYRMSVTLYDIETQEIIDSAWDVLRKKVKA